MALDLFEEFKQILQALDAAGIDHAVVGALAVAIHGAPRATADIELLVEAADLQRAIDVARTRGFTWLANPMRFRDGTELQRISKIAGDDTLTLDLILVNDNLAETWRSRADLDRVRIAVRGLARGADRDEGRVRSAARPGRRRQPRGDGSMIDYTPAAITARLRRASAMADLRTERRLDAKLDMTPRGVTSRLRQVEQLRRLCVQLARAGRAAET